MLRVGARGIKKPEAQQLLLIKQNIQEALKKLAEAELQIPPELASATYSEQEFVTNYETVQFLRNELKTLETEKIFLINQAEENKKHLLEMFLGFLITFYVSKLRANFLYI